MTRSHAVDDFPAIRARMEELRRERARVPDDDSLRRRAESSRPYFGSNQPTTADKPGLSPAIRREFKARTG